MSEKKLTDTELANFIHWSEVYAGVTDSELSIALEAKEYRALMATAMPCGWPAPTVVSLSGHGSIDVVRWDALGDSKLDPDEAEALGAALIRAARLARGGAE